MECPLVKCLAQELRACPAPMDPVLFAAARDDGSNAAVSLDFACALVSFTLASQSSNQPRRHSRTGPGKGLDQRVIRMRSGELVDLLVVSGDSYQNLLEQTRPC